MALEQVSLTAHQFSLSVPFHQCSIFIFHQCHIMMVTESIQNNTLKGKAKCQDIRKKPTKKEWTQDSLARSWHLVVWTGDQTPHTLSYILVLTACIMAHLTIWAMTQPETWYCLRLGTKAIIFTQHPTICTLAQNQFSLLQNVLYSPLLWYYQTAPSDKILWNNARVSCKTKMHNSF